MQDDFDSESNQRMQFDGFNDNLSNKVSPQSLSLQRTLHVPLQHTSPTFLSQLRSTEVNRILFLHSHIQKAKLVPLGAEENLRTLASLGYLPGSNNNSFHPIPFSSESNFISSEGPSSPTSSSIGTPEDSTCPLPSFFNQDPMEGRFEGTASYPKFDIYPSSNKHNNIINSQSHSGILQPDMSPTSEDHMDLDGGDMMMDRGHG